jgi:D-3-phosphoglycerate dehydrogenase
MRVTILDDYFDTLRHLPSFEKLAGIDVEVLTSHIADPLILADRLQDTEVLVLFRERTPLTEELLQLLPHLRLIAMRGTHQTVDVAACTRLGILLSSDMQRGGAAAHPTAELTWALILASMRQIPRQAASLKAGTWQSGVGRSLNGLTIGIYGYGRIGRAVAGYAKAFGMRVHWWGSEDGRSRATDAGESVPRSRHAFFAESDVVSLHVRLAPSTEGIVSSDDLSQMQPSSLLVNTSRAMLIEAGALLKALQAGRPGFAALDVFEDEPVVEDPLAMHPNVLATPHIGFVTEDELDRQFSSVYDLVTAYANGQPTSVINPEAVPQVNRGG